MREHHEQFYANKLGNLFEIEKFLEIHELLKPIVGGGGQRKSEDNL